MAKSSPEKLAAALRANLKRRKQPALRAPSQPPKPAARPVQKSPKSPQ